MNMIANDVYQLLPALRAKGITVEELDSYFTIRSPRGVDYVFKKDHRGSWVFAYSVGAGRSRRGYNEGIKVVQLVKKLAL